MRFVLFDRFTRLSFIRAAFWLLMGLCLLSIQNFLLGGSFYLLIGYLLINAVLRIILFIRETTTKHEQRNTATIVFRYISLMLAVLLIITAVHLIIFRDWLNEFTPVFLGALLMLEGILYFMIALCAATALQKFLLILLSTAAFFDAVTGIIFTFGFGIGGVYGITMVLGITLLCAFLYEITASCIARKICKNRFQSKNQIIT